MEARIVETLSNPADRIGNHSYVPQLLLSNILEGLYAMKKPIFLVKPTPKS